MSSARPLCVLCERPTADGFIQTVNVDKEKLQTWLLNICGNEFAEEIQDQDLICYFCIWHAEFLAKHGLIFGTDSWWPQDLNYLDDAAKELRKSYFDGKIEQCWVQLENVDDSEEGKETGPKSQTEMEKEVETEHGSRTEQKMRKCVYCYKSYRTSKKLGKHVRNAHKNAIRCENHLCATYFHTIEEKEEHVKNFHETPRERKIYQCCFCEKQFQGNDNYRSHVEHVHTEYPVKCSFRGCIKYFKTEDERNSHFDSAHKEEDEAKAHECKHCGFRAKIKRDLERHLAAKHLPKTIKCEKCDKLFSAMKFLKIHDRRDHSLKICSICQKEVTLRNISFHMKKQKCCRCKNIFDCLGLFQTHREICKETQFKCGKCKMSFVLMSLLIYHEKRKHRINSWRGLQHRNLGLKCEPCKKYFKSAAALKSHLKYKRSSATLKRCAHCPKSFIRISNLKAHLAMRHNLIERKFECDFCKKTFLWKCVLLFHIERSHLDRTRGKCKICGKEMLISSIGKHLFYVHGQL